jgi:hypothetical protein
MADLVETSPDSGASIAVLLADLDTYRFEIGVPVGPSLARRIIELNDTNQRNLKVRKRDLYAKTMAKGAWRERTGQVIQISCDGTLLNGQTRLHAVVQSGATIRFDLCFGVAREDIVVLDAHTPRSAVDTIRAAGGDDLTRVAAIVNHIVAWDAGSPMGPSGSTAVDPVDLLDRYQADANLFEAAARRGADCGNRNVGTPAAIGVAYFLLARNPADKPYADDFFDMIASGIYPGVAQPQRSAPYRLREKLIRRKIEKLSRAEMLALIFRAWNRWNTFDADGNRVFVDRLQMNRRSDLGQDRLSNANFPKVRRANTKGAPDETGAAEG